MAKAKSGWLRPPYNGTYRLTSFFDHHYPNYGTDGEITIYTGESVADCSPHCYEGHSGYDWSMATGTPVLASASGVVRARVNSTTGYGRRLVIDHENGYYTLYAHLNSFNVALNQRVADGDVIAWSGSTGTPAAHLHFGVYRGPVTAGAPEEQYATDPFGWRGSYPDPLRNFPSAGQGHTASCLWRSHDEDPISCADTIVEDAGQGSATFGAWNVSTMGNGYHMYYRYTTADGNDDIYATWTSTATHAGPHKVYAYIPSQFGTTLNATYWIWDGTNWQQAPTVQQLYHSDEWVLLGTYTLPANFAYVWMYANTWETPARWIAADGIKFRQYRVNLPLTLCDYPPCTPGDGQLIANGNFDTGDDDGWTTSRSNGPDPIVQPYGGTDYGAWMGRYNFNQDTMYQFACPVGSAGYAALSFRWWMSSGDTPYVDVDFLHVRVRDANGNLLQTLVTVTNRSAQGQWYYEYFDLLTYAGETIRISFEASTDGSYPTNFWVDNVSFFVSIW